MAILPNMNVRESDDEEDVEEEREYPVHVNPLQLDLAVWSGIDQILSTWKKGMTTSKRWIGEAQGEIKGSLEEVGEGDQTVVVVATLDRPVNSWPTELHCSSKVSLAEHLSFSLQDRKKSHNDLEEITGASFIKHFTSHFSVVLTYSI